MLKLPIIIFIGNLYSCALVLKSNISSINELTLKQKIIGQCDVKHIMMSSVLRQAHYDAVSVMSNTLWCRQCDVKHIMMPSVWRQAHYDVVSVTSNTLWCRQCDVKHIMMSPITIITSVLKVSTYIITSITALPIRLAEILVTMYVSTFKTAIIILYLPELWTWDIQGCWSWYTRLAILRFARFVINTRYQIVDLGIF